jgi:hypothetical protein
MEPVIVTGMVRAGGVSISRLAGRTRVEILLNPGQSAQIAQIIEMMEKGIVCKAHIVGDKGTDVEVIVSMWKIRTTVDGGLVFVFEMDRGNAVNSVKMSDSSLLLEQLTITLEGDPKYGFHTRKNRQSKWTATKREYPN